MRPRVYKSNGLWSIWCPWHKRVEDAGIIRWRGAIQHALVIWADHQEFAYEAYLFVLGDITRDEYETLVTTTSTGKGQ